MDKYYFGSIVLLKFPFSDAVNIKRRPALIINDCNDGDIIVCRITSQIYRTANDIYVDNWDKSGLKLPSVIRVHKLATLEKGMVEMVLGEIDTETKNKVKMAISKLTE